MVDFVWIVLALAMVSLLVWRAVVGYRGWRARKQAHELFRKQGFRLVDKSEPVRFVRNGPDLVAVVGDKAFTVKESGWEPLERRAA